MDKIKFYSTSDLSCGYYLSKVEKVLCGFDPNQNKYTINEIIEFYNISKYIDAEVYLKSWTKEDIAQFKIVVTDYKDLIGRFFNSISDNNFKDLFGLVDGEYTDDFWKLIEKFKVFEKVSSDTISEFLHQSDVSLYEILCCKKMVNHYGQVIKNQLLLEETAAEIMLDKYEMKNDNIHLPRELNADDKETIILNYIASPNPNLNYLRLIINIQSVAEFVVSDRTRLKAKKRAEIEESKIFNKNTGVYTEFKVVFLENQEEAIKQETIGRSWSFSYSLKWIRNNIDYNTLMNNFIYLFEFVDSQMRITLVNKLQEMGILERDAFLHSKNAYTKGMAFDGKNILSNLQLVGYYQVLLRHGIRLEEIVKWFFEKYVVEEFKIEKFKINMPSEHSLYIEKCRAILPEMESILKQFSLFVRDKSIDHDLLQMSSGQLLYRDIPSLFDKKYVYGIGPDFKRVTHYFFSDQCMLSYIKRVESKYKSFFELLIHEDIRVSDYPEYHQWEINWLIKHNYIELDSDRNLKICDINQIYILKDLYYDEVISYWRCPSALRKTIDNMEKLGVVELESTLFSRDEQDYFNYHLNKSCFNNALDLRNIYSHGTQPSGDESEKIHRDNYMIFLKLFILIIIKINDELCLYANNKV